MTRCLPALALLLLLAAPARAEEGAEERGPKVLVMSRAKVVASPGCPSAIESFLPGGKRPETLAWPLPKEGSLILLGLSESDPVARRVADVFQLDVEPETLHGGYRIHAWQDGRRNMVFVFAADAAALQAARFEFQDSAAIEMMDPNMRSLDFKKPNQEAGVQVFVGNRVVKPRYAVRALAPGRDPRDDAGTTVAGARGNRLWIGLDVEQDRASRAIRRARAQGVEPVLVIRRSAANQEDPKLFGATAKHTIWRTDKSLRKFALVFDTPLALVRETRADYARWERQVAAAVAKRLREDVDLEELVIVPRCHSDDLARHVAPPPDVTDIPEAMIAWSGPNGHSTQVSREEAERRVKEAGVPVLLLETWAAPFQQGPARDAYIPSLPAGRARDLGEVLAGIVVVGAHGTEATLESAWDPEAEERFGMELLTELFPRDEKDVMEFLRVLSVRLDHESKVNLGLVPWMAPLAADLRAITKPPTLVPQLTRTPVNDGRLDDDVWDGAVKLPIEKKGVVVRLLSDGSALHIAVKLDRKEIGNGPFLMQLRLRSPGRSDTWVLKLTHETLSFDQLGEKGVMRIGPGHLTYSRRSGPEGFTVEATFDRFALGGDAHEMRRFEFGVSWGPTNLWPKANKNGAAGTLLVVK